MAEMAEAMEQGGGVRDEGEEGAGMEWPGSVHDDFTQKR